LIGLLLLFRAHFVLYIAKGESMMPGLRSGDLVLVDRLAYRAEQPKRGDIVVARDRGDLIVKRVVGLPGEEVELREAKLYVNRLPLAEDYAVEPGQLSLRKGRLFGDKYALLGDNRSVPVSLSVHAVASKDQIVGRVIHSVHLWPGWLRPGFNQAT
jgi:signal peptidase I